VCCHARLGEGGSQDAQWYLLLPAITHHLRDAQAPECARMGRKTPCWTAGGKAPGERAAQEDLRRAARVEKQKCCSRPAGGPPPAGAVGATAAAFTEAAETATADSHLTAAVIIAILI
jgi:hypothetical protein